MFSGIVPSSIDLYWGQNYIMNSHTFIKSVKLWKNKWRRGRAGSTSFTPNTSMLAPIFWDLCRGVIFKAQGRYDLDFVPCCSLTKEICSALGHACDKVKSSSLGKSGNVESGFITRYANNVSIQTWMNGDDGYTVHSGESKYLWSVLTLMEHGWWGHLDQNDDFSMSYIMEPRAICVKKARPCVQGKWHRGHVVLQQDSIQDDQNRPNGFHTGKQAWSSID